MHLSQLYELSLAIGQSTDVNANCEHFMSALMTIMQLDHTSVWLDARRLSELDLVDEVQADESYLSIFSSPRDKGGAAPLSAEHPLVQVLIGSESHSSSPPGDRFRAINSSIRGNEGAVALFRLGDLGFISWYSKYHKGPYLAGEFNEIRSLLYKFAASMETCLDHQLMRREVTLRKRAEVAVRHSEEHFRSLIENALDVILVLDYDGTITFASPSVERVLGFKPQELEGSSLFSQVHPEEATKLFYRFQQEVMTPGNVAPFEFRFAHNGGGWRTVSAATNNLLANPAVKGIIVTLNDVTERNLMREALHRSEQRYSLAVQGANDGIWDWDVSTGDLYLSPRWKEMLGYGDEELPSSPQSWFQLVEKDDLDGLRTAIDGQSGEQFPQFHHQYRMRHKDGSTLWMLTRGTAVHDDEGVVVRMAGSQTDITDRIRYTSELEDARHRAVEASRAKGEFLANMSHEIRTPMNGVIGMASLLLERVTDPEHREYVETIRTSGETLLAVVNDILDFSKVEAGRLELERAPFDIMDCVEGAMDVVAPLLADRDVGIGAWLEGSVPDCVVGDLARVRQVMVNLLSNAAKFTERGHILVTISSQPSGDELEEIQFEVRDSGIGIAEEALDKLFSPFSQADASTTRRYGGTGLGLAICRRLTELLGGKIWVESRVGVGSAFMFTIIVQPTVASEEAAPIVALPPLEHQGALVVKEDPALAEVVANHLLRLGGEAVVVAGLKEAADWLGDNPSPAVILVDARLVRDRIDEWTVLAKAAAGTPMIAMAPLGARIDSAVENDAAANLSEPLKRRQVVAVLGRVLGQDESGPRAVQQIEQAEERLQHLAILLAEDNPVNQKVAQLMLKRLGCVCELVTNGVEVLQAVEEKAFDVILMDVQMPSMDGLEATQRIRSGSGRGRPWIIAMTAHALAEDRERCLDAGMDSYLAKPMDLDQLQEALVEAAQNVDDIGQSAAAGGSDSGAVPSLKVVEAFLADLPALLARLGKARDSRDLDEIVRAAIVIRGAAGVAGQETLAASAGHLEQTAARRRFDEVGDLIDDLGCHFDEVRAELEGDDRVHSPSAVESPPEDEG